LNESLRLFFVQKSSNIAGSPELSGLPPRPLKALNESLRLFFVQKLSYIAGSPDASGLPSRPLKALTVSVLFFYDLIFPGFKFQTDLGNVAGSPE